MPSRTVDGQQLYIPPLGKSFQMVDLLDFTHHLVLDGQGFATWTPAGEFVITHVGAKLDPAGLPVHRDMELERGEAGHGSLHLTVDEGQRPSSFSLFHMAYFFPQLHELRIRLTGKTSLHVRGPPGCDVIVAGIVKVLLP